MTCPSTSAPPTLTTADARNGMYVGDYKPVTRIGTALAGAGGLLSTASPPVAATDDQLLGVMVTNAKVKISAVTDGTSNTILIAEAAGNSQLYRQGKVFDPNPLTGAPWSDRNSLMAPTGYDPAKANVPASSSTRPGLVTINGTNNSEVYSFHSGGANAVFADGHVQFLRDSIAPQTFVALATRAGGEVVGDY
jgi:prepilin-type processing-associated H-X9-DG protein